MGVGFGPPPNFSYGVKGIKWKNHEPAVTKLLSNWLDLQVAIWQSISRSGSSRQEERDTMQDGTYSINQGEFYQVKSWTTGYWVAETHNIYVPKTHEERLEYAQGMMDRYGTPFVGVWRDGEDIYFDASHHVEDLIQAIAMGRHWKQSTIWDIKYNQLIRIR